MTTTATPQPKPAPPPPIARDNRTWLLLGFTFLLVAGFWTAFRQWYGVSQASDDSSHLVLMPLVAAYLLYVNRRRIFDNAGQDRRFLALLLVAGTAALGASLMPLENWHPQDQSALRVALLVTTWIAGFGLINGASAVRRGLFPLGMLLLMIPIPTYVLSQMIAFLLWGSAEGTAIVFSLVGTPVFREGYTFILPGVSIEVAEECSGIRSTMALLITGLLASHFFLKSNTSKALLVLAVVPLAIVKNCIRIATLTYLAVYVDPSFLSGALHKRGGIVFFLITLVLFGLVLLVLQRVEDRKSRAAGSATAAGH